jgi:hypothetical protein
VRTESLSFAGDLAYFRIELEFQVPMLSVAMGITRSRVISVAYRWTCWYETASSRILI